VEAFTFLLPHHQLNAARRAARAAGLSVGEYLRRAEEAYRGDGELTTERQTEPFMMGTGNESEIIGSSSDRRRERNE
jgi:hypothetical protein